MSGGDEDAGYGLGGATSKIFHHGGHGAARGNVVHHEGIRDMAEGSDEVRI
jgi:hypothetical protein